MGQVYQETLGSAIPALETRVCPVCCAAGKGQQSFPAAQETLQRSDGCPQRSRRTWNSWETMSWAVGLWAGSQRPCPLVSVAWTAVWNTEATWHGGGQQPAGVLTSPPPVIACLWVSLQPLGIMFSSLLCCICANESAQHISRAHQTVDFIMGLYSPRAMGETWRHFKTQ